MHDSIQFIYIYRVTTTEGGGLAVKSVIPSGLGCEGPRFESRNRKHLGLNPTIPTLDSLVPSWGWDNTYSSPVPSGPSYVESLCPVIGVHIYINCVASMFALLFAFVFGLIVYIEYLLNIGQINSLI